MHTFITTVLEFISFLAISLGIVSPVSRDIESEKLLSSVSSTTDIVASSTRDVGTNNPLMKKFEETSFLLGTSTLKELLRVGILALEKSQDETLRLQLLSYFLEYSKRIPYDKEMERIHLLLLGSTSTCGNVNNVDCTK